MGFSLKSKICVGWHCRVCGARGELIFDATSPVAPNFDGTCCFCGASPVALVRAKAVVCDGGPDTSVAPSIFSEAEQTINGPRAEDYGDANESFDRIAALWSAYLNTPVSSADVGMMMSLLKMVRLKYSKFAHHDSFVDLLGYVGLAHKVSGEK